MTTITLICLCVVAFCGNPVAGQITTYTVTTIEEKPYYFTDENGKKTGFINELLEEMQKRDQSLKFDIRLVKDGMYGAKINGRWTGMIGEVVHNRADVAAAALTITLEREQAVDFTKPFSSVGLVAVLKKPQQNLVSGYLMMFMPFKWTVWVAIAVATIISTIALVFLIKLQLRKSACQQNGVCRCSPGLTIALVGVTIFLALLVATYSASLHVLLRGSSGDGSFRTIADLVRTNIRFSALKGGSTENTLKTSKVADVQRIWSVMRNDKNALVESTENGLSQVRNTNGKYAFIMERGLADYSVNKEPCDLYVLNDQLNVPVRHYAFAVQKNSQLNVKLSIAMMQIQQDGVMTVLEEKWFKRSGSCQDKETANGEDGVGEGFSTVQSAAQSGIKEVQFAGALIFLAVALILAAIVGFVEHRKLGGSNQHRYPENDEGMKLNVIE